MLTRIPEFADHGGLPSFVNGDPTIPDARSPFRVSIQSLIDRFCTTKDRATLLKGLNEYRKHLYSGGFIAGSQWIDGSFVENVEKISQRSPNDIDLITLYHRPIKYQQNPQLWALDYQNNLHSRFFNTHSMKKAFYCDTYDIDLDAGAKSIVRNSTYWFGLFSDMRGNGAKKGIVEIELASDPKEFTAIAKAIESRFDV